MIGATEKILRQEYCPETHFKYTQETVLLGKRQRQSFAGKCLIMTYVYVQMTKPSRGCMNYDFVFWEQRRKLYDIVTGQQKDTF